MDKLARYEHFPDTLFAGPSTPNLPPRPAPPALPEVGEAGDIEARRVKRRRGRRETILTGALEPEPQKKILLG